MRRGVRRGRRGALAAGLASGGRGALALVEVALEILDPLAGQEGLGEADDVRAQAPERVERIAESPGYRMACDAFRHSM